MEHSCQQLLYCAPSHTSGAETLTDNLGPQCGQLKIRDFMGVRIKFGPYAFLEGFLNYRICAYDLPIDFF